MAVAMSFLRQLGSAELWLGQLESSEERQVKQPRRRGRIVLSTRYATRRAPFSMSAAFQLGRVVTCAQTASSDAPNYSDSDTPQSETLIDGSALHKLDLHEAEEDTQHAAQNEGATHMQFCFPNKRGMQPIQEWIVLLIGKKRCCPRGASCVGGGKLLSSCSSNKQGLVSNSGHAR